MCLVIVHIQRLEVTAMPVNAPLLGFLHQQGFVPLPVPETNLELIGAFTPEKDWFIT